MNASNFSSQAELSGVELFQLYYTPFLVYLGIVGNGLSVVVFFKTKLKKLSSSYYLAALALSDSVFLVALFVVWLNMVEVNLFNQHGVCQLMVYLTGACSFLSVWLVLAFTVERFVAVKYPLLRQSLCTISRAKIAIIILIFLAMLLFSPLLMFARVQAVRDGRAPYLCTIDARWQHAAGLFNVVDTVVTFLVPVVVVAVLNVAIGRTVWRLAAVRRSLTHRPKRKRAPKNTLRQNKVTKMLLVVSTVCLCLNLPSYVMRILAYLIELQVVRDVNIPLFSQIQHGCLQLFNTNFGINFVLYCISGQNFRRAVKTLMCTRRLRRKDTAAFAVSESQTQSTAAAASSVSRRKRTAIFETQELATIHVRNN